MATGPAWRALLSPADLEPFGSFLVVGATGGVGHMAVHIASRIANVEVVSATTSKEEKAAFLRVLGADRVIDYTEDSSDRRIWELTDGTGVDVVYNNVVGETWVKSMRALGKGGRLVVSGATAGPNHETEIRLSSFDSPRYSGAPPTRARIWSGRSRRSWTAPSNRSSRRCSPFEGYAEAFRMMANREVFGNLVRQPE